MSVRDEELTRLVKYAEGMGLKVIFKKRSPDNDAEWTVDGSAITVYTKNHTTKTEILCSLIHELGHHVWFIHEKNRQPDLRFEEALDRQDLFDSKKTLLPAPKRLRKKILEVEKAGAQWWDSIYKDTNMKFPLWKLHASREFDIWMYEEYYKNGMFPTYTRRVEKDREVRARHKLAYEEVKNGKSE